MIRVSEVKAADPSALPFLKALQSFNVKTFSFLLRLVVDELQQLTMNDGSTLEGPTAVVPATTRRTLSHLRLYSAWLLSTLPLLLANDDLAAQMRQLWQLYAAFLNLIIRLFRFKTVEVEYLLKEDEETLAFSAFTPLVRKKRFCKDSEHFKPVYSEASHGPRLPNNEMLFRLKGMVQDARRLLQDVSNSPYSEMRFLTE